ncbi:uncharacterized protein LOC122266712 [Penaeus japonicus]|uniref:uncharacterized protein LOC122266709 n=1 Tax=Penaeus japonicus TaxID=27405 RepID=UPI001C70D443|nr:uncharacterized protein LOC122266709 [Penaeus japonicus]XP_042892475.1 uncharacterized protein LOC122266710 [Penaeus japonicus]XP_042892478.1 uncharacterized protein LOC122266712 [Penaeus japonicus]
MQRIHTVNMAGWRSLCVWLLLAASLAAATPVGRSPSSAVPVIRNGTRLEISPAERTFVFCSAELEPIADLHHYQVAWRDSDGHALSQDPETPLFTLGRGTHVPHSYLVLAPFGPDSAGEYSCVLFFRGREVASSTVHLQTKTTRSARSRNKRSSYRTAS